MQFLIEHYDLTDFRLFSALCTKNIEQKLNILTTKTEFLLIKWFDFETSSLPFSLSLTHDMEKKGQISIMGVY